MVKVKAGNHEPWAGSERSIALSNCTDSGTPQLRPTLSLRVAALAIVAERESIAKEGAERQHHEGEGPEGLQVSEEVRNAAVSNEGSVAPLDEEAERESRYSADCRQKR